MTNNELKIYMENRTRQFTNPEVIACLEKLVNEILQTTQFTITQKFIVVITFEYLCFTIHTAKGREMYIKLLNHIVLYFPDIAEKYWAIFDNQENLIKRYCFPKTEY